MSKKNNILTAPVVSKALRAGDLCILQDGGSLTLEVTGKNQGKWLYRGRKQGSRTLIKLIGKLYIVFHSSNAALRASILEYLGVEGLNINFLPSSSLWTSYPVPILIFHLLYFHLYLYYNLIPVPGKEKRDVL